RCGRRGRRAKEPGWGGWIVMPASVDSPRVVAAAAPLAAERRGDTSGGLVADFLRHYYERVSAEDLVARRPAELLGSAMAHWRAAGGRPRGTPLLNIYKPPPGGAGRRGAPTLPALPPDAAPAPPPPPTP